MLQAMRILLVANDESDKQAGMLRYASWLAHALQLRGHDVALTRPRPFFSRWTSQPTLHRYLGYIDKFILFPPKLKRLTKQFDLIHILDHSNASYLSAVAARPNLVTCHDMLAVRSARGEFPQATVGPVTRFFQARVLKGLQSAKNLICVSEKTASDLHRLAGDSNAAQRVIHNTLNWHYRPGASLTRGLTAGLGLIEGDPYILHVGGNFWYKNRLGVLKIFAELSRRPGYENVRLIMAGEPWTQEMLAFRRKEGLIGRAFEVVGAANEELEALYSNALALLFPSLEEGFGWPILEAQACGCPVIISGRTPLTEVAGVAAIYIDPEHPYSAADAIVFGLNKREELREAGFENLKRFDEDKIVDEYCSFYAEIVAAK